jgi:hypothetical protein
MVRSQKPRGPNLFSAAFGSTLLAILFLPAGILGYEIKKHNWHFVDVAWTGSAVWWEICLGLMGSVLAVYFWRKALQSID